MFRTSEKKLFSSFSMRKKRTYSETRTNTDESVSDFKKRNRLFEVWIPSKLMTKLEAELKTFGGENQKEQFITFWNWYFHAKDENQLLKPENKEELPQDPDALKCKYYAFSCEQWYCNREKIPKEVCLQTCRNFGKNCLPRRIMEKRQIEQARQENRKHSGSSRSRNYNPLETGKTWREPDVWKGDT